MGKPFSMDLRDRVAGLAFVANGRTRIDTRADAEAIVVDVYAMLSVCLVCPILVPVAHADNEDVAVLFDSIDDEMGFERMDAHRW